MIAVADFLATAAQRAIRMVLVLLLLLGVVGLSNQTHVYDVGWGPTPLISIK